MAKPSIAVLGLEVVDPSGTPTAADTQVAKELSDGLRARANAGTGPYQLAPGSNKELIDQKLLNNCDSEAPQCMSAIGGQLGADILMFGKIEKKDKEKAYQVSIRVLDVSRKQIQKQTSDMIPLSESSGAAVQGWAKRIYAKLTGDTSAAGGTIIVKLSNADRGTILINNEERGNITNGSGTVAGLDGGKTYRLSVESEGFRRWEKDVSVTNNKTETVSVSLEAGGPGDVIGPGPGPGPGPSDGVKRGSTKWKAIFAGVVVVGVGGGGYLWYSGNNQIKDSQAALCAGGAYYKVDSACMELPDGDPAKISDARIAELNDDGDKGKYKTWFGAPLAITGAAVGFYAFYKGFIAKSSPSSSERQSARGKRVRRERFIVTPIVAPNGGGATLRLDW